MQTEIRDARREARTHGDALFPLAGYWYRAEPEMPVVDCHWHGEAEFLLVLEGQTLFQIGPERFPVRAGEAVFVHGGDIHAGYPLGGEGCRFFAVVFDMNLLASGTPDRLQSEYVLPLVQGKRSLPAHYTARDPLGRAVLAELDGLGRELADKRPGYELAAKSRLYRILAEVAANGRWVSRTRNPEAEAYDLHLLKRVLTHVEKNYNKRIYIRELAQLAHMTDSQFCRFFKRWVCKTPVEYINGYRVRRAAELLERSDRKMPDIAMEVGFDNPSYFIRRFRKEMRCTPAAYRRGVRGKPVPDDPGQTPSGDDRNRS